MTDTYIGAREPIVEEEGSKSPSIFWQFPDRNSQHQEMSNNFLGNDRWEL